MANVSHPDSRDPNRPFSGPLLPSGSDGGVGESGSVVAPLIDQLRLLKNSSPDEFQRLYEGVMDASEETRPMTSTRQRMSRTQVPQCQSTTETKWTIDY